jgi:hypothetical protein
MPCGAPSGTGSGRISTIRSPASLNLLEDAMRRAVRHRVGADLHDPITSQLGEEVVLGDRLGLSGGRDGIELQKGQRRCVMPRRRHVTAMCRLP